MTLEHPTYNVLRITRIDGHVNVYRIAPGYEELARAYIWAHLLDGQLSVHEAALLNQATYRLSPPRPVLRVVPTMGLVRGFIKRLIGWTVRRLVKR